MKKRWSKRKVLLLLTALSLAFCGAACLVGCFMLDPLATILTLLTAIPFGLLTFISFIAFYLEDEDGN